MSTRRSFFAQLAGGLSLLVSGKTLAEVPSTSRWGVYSYQIRTAWKPVRLGVIPILYKRCGVEFKPPQMVSGELKWYRRDGTPLVS